MSTRLSPFHLSFAVEDLDRAKRFYVDTLGCTERRRTPTLVEYEFFGHHLVAHHAPDEVTGLQARQIGKHGTPLRHFGVILPLEEFDTVAKRLTASGAEFILAPESRYAGEPREQLLMVCRDQCGNAIEFKGLRQPQDIFA